MGDITTNGESMTQQEVMDALDKAGIDYNFIEEFDGSMHVIIKFEEEEND
jgi:molecular chaperone GrpE (heat shock protein)